MKFLSGSRRSSGSSVLLGIALIPIIILLSTREGIASQGRPQLGAQNETSVFIPIAFSNHRYLHPFGTESTRGLLPGSTLLEQADQLGARWARLGYQVSWDELQPVEGGSIDWSKLAQFENELRAVKAAGITPVVTIKRSPDWALIPNVRKDGQLTSCGPIRADKFGAFAHFVRALVSRYKSAPFNVRHWELGNEPDVDPDMVGVDWGFGCWGDVVDQEFYGGKHYGEMLKVIGRAIKEVDPEAKVWLGGLLLATPETTDPRDGHPERFLRGVLAAGAAPYIDFIAYHWYPPYLNNVSDHDISMGPWAEWGGGTIGKAVFIRRILEEYGITKPLALNETGLMCIESTSYCNPPVPSFHDMRADNLIRSFVRALSIDIKAISWYTLNGPGWQSTGLLDEADAPTEAYWAYQELAGQMDGARYIGPVDYDPGIEAYEFRRGNEVVQVIWARANEVIPINVSAESFIGLYDRDGDEIPPTALGGEYQILVGFSPVFLILTP